MSSSQEKTELPSPKRRREAREKGNVPRSKDLATAGGILAAAGVLPSMAEGLGTYVQNRLAAPLPTDLDMSGALLIVTNTGEVLASLLVPLFVAVFVASALALMLPSGPVIAVKKLELDVEKIAPWKGISRLNPSQTVPKAFLDMLRMAVVLAAAAHLLVAGNGEALSALASGSTLGSAKTLLELVSGLAMRIGVAFLLVAVFEFLLERRRIEKELRMTRQELKEELKRDQGDPMLKARVRRIQREMSQRRLKDVQNASVVVTNPTHVACALQYQRGLHGAPRLIAKGRDAMAQEIKKIAREAGVPCHEDKPLAWALLRVPVGAEIPEHLYRAVAEVLALIERAKQRRRGKK